MQVQCPSCHTLLSLAGVHAPQVQCPGCGTVLDVSHLARTGSAQVPHPAGSVATPTHPAQPQGVQSGPAVSVVAGGGSPVSAGAAVQPTRSTSVVSATRLRRKKSYAGIWAAGGLLVAVLGLAAFAVVKISGDSDKPADNPVVVQARSLVAQELSLPAEAQFVAEYQASQGRNGLWTVESQVIIPVLGKSVRRHWRADVAVRDGKYQLQTLMLDGRRVTLGQAHDDPVRLASSAGAEGPPESGDDGDSAAEDRTIGGAVRKVAAAAADAAKRRKTLVVWLIDHSDSAASWRDSFAQHSSTVLDLLNNEQMSMAVVAFAEEVQFLVEEPSRDTTAIREALERSPESPGGKERTFQAIKAAAETYRSFQAEGGYVYLVVVSDEAGDDPQLADEVTAALRRDSIPVYAIGREAPFGRRTWETEMNPDVGPKQTDPRSEGPESQAVERIALSFWNGGYSDPGMLGSGYGPFALTRLCLQTGGEFFACQGTGSVSRGSSGLTFRSWSSGGWGGSAAPAGFEFSPALRRRYAPDYVTDAEYQALLQGNAAYRALVNAGKLEPIDMAALLQYDFEVTNEAALKRQLDDAQRNAARLEPKLSALYEALATGEKERDKVQSPRWQAGYDLAMGRVLAARARIEGYNAMLAQLKLGRNFENESSTRWVLAPSDTTSAGSNYARLMDQAKKYLERVVNDHPGTPWAHLASRELKQKMGWEWQER